jgi:hypothetical protein
MGQFLVARSPHTPLAERQMTDLNKLADALADKIEASGTIMATGLEERVIDLLRTIATRDDVFLRMARAESDENQKLRDALATEHEARVRAEELGSEIWEACRTIRDMPEQGGCDDDVSPVDLWRAMQREARRACGAFDDAETPRISTLTARIAELEEALRPFANAADGLDPEDFAPDRPSHGRGRVTQNHLLTARHVLRRALLKQGEG